MIPILSHDSNKVQFVHTGVGGVRLNQFVAKSPAILTKSTGPIGQWA